MNIDLDSLRAFFNCMQHDYNYVTTADPAALTGKEKNLCQAKIHCSQLRLIGGSLATVSVLSGLNSIFKGSMLDLAASIVLFVIGHDFFKYGQNGYDIYDNPKETLKSLWKTLKKSDNVLSDLWNLDETENRAIFQRFTEGMFFQTFVLNLLLNHMQKEKAAKAARN